MDPREGMEVLIRHFKPSKIYMEKVSRDKELVAS
jgi:hypothetical protein